MVFEWVMGNFFPMMVMGLFSVFWGSFGFLQLPTLQLGAPFATADDPTGLASREYNAAVAIYLIVWGFALFTFFIFTCKINAVFAAIFLLVSVAAWVLSGAYWKVSWGDYEGAARLQKVSILYRACVGKGLLTSWYREEERYCSLWPLWAGTCVSSSWRERCALHSTYRWAISAIFGPGPMWSWLPRSNVNTRIDAYTWNFPVYRYC
jgi:hypothetical protein